LQFIKNQKVYTGNIKIKENTEKQNMSRK